MLLHLAVVFVFVSCVASQTSQCNDIDSSACKLLESGKPDLCQDPSLSQSACPRYCKLCPIECHHCNATVLDYHDCNTTMQCAKDEVCMIKELKSFVDGHHEYEMTCALKQLCDGGSGLNIPFGKRSVVNRDITISCCDTDFCNYPGPNSCPKDVVFLVDESSRLLEQDHIAVIRTLFNVVQGLDIGNTDFLVGLYGYDTSMHRKFDLNTYTEKNGLLREIQLASLFRRFHSTRDDTNEAIKFLVDNVLTPQHGDRPGFPDAVVIIADPTTARNTQISLANQAALQQKSNDVIVVSVGSSANSTAEQVATDSSHMIHVPSGTINFDATLVPQLLHLLQKC